MIFIVCGVSGSGKSTIGRILASELGLPFFDADNFHPESNVQKMRRGLALNDEDRQPWLSVLANELSEWEAGSGAVLACSALKESYRKTLATKCNDNIKWIILKGSKALLTERITARKGHYFNPLLLESQLNTLELPNYGLHLNVQQSPDELVNEIKHSIA